MIINHAKENKYSSDQTLSPIVLPSILAVKKSLLDMKTINIQYPLKTENHNRKITSFQIFPENLNLDKSVDIPLNRSTNRTNSVQRANNKKLTTIVPARKLTSIDFKRKLRSQVFGTKKSIASISHNSAHGKSLDQQQLHRINCIDIMSSKLKEMTHNQGSDMKVIHIKSISNQLKNIKLPIDGPQLIDSLSTNREISMKLNQSFFKKNIYAVKRNELKESSKLIKLSNKLDPIMKQRKFEILSMANKEYKLLVNKQSEIEKYVKENVSLLNEFKLTNNKYFN